MIKVKLWTCSELEVNDMAQADLLLPHIFEVRYDCNYDNS